jgi:periplasmic divalent cation tolerance protein
MEIIQVVSTVDSRERAEEIVRAVVGKRLAACGQIIGPIRSTYWWQGQIEEAEEWQCLFKTVAGAYSDLERTILDRHPYDVAEIIAMPVSLCSAPYLEWCEREVGQREAS